MSQPIHLFNITVFDAESMATTVTSDSLNIQQAAGYAVQAVWSGTSPVGTFTVEASNDNINFTSILNSPVAISGNTGSLMINVENAFYGFIRVVYTATSGSGSLTVHINAQSA